MLGVAPAAGMRIKLWSQCLRVSIEGPGIQSRSPTTRGSVEVGLDQADRCLFSQADNR